MVERLVDLFRVGQYEFHFVAEVKFDFVDQLFVGLVVDREKDLPFKDSQRHDEIPLGELLRHNREDARINADLIDVDGRRASAELFKPGAPQVFGLAEAPLKRDLPERAVRRVLLGQNLLHVMRTQIRSLRQQLANPCLLH
jgi:hypothetical protein